jgi:hypothetical protein
MFFSTTQHELTSLHEHFDYMKKKHQIRLSPLNLVIMVKANDRALVLHTLQTEWLAQWSKNTKLSYSCIYVTDHKVYY